MWNDFELSKMVDGGIPYPMLSDETGNIGKLYEVYDQQKGKTIRGTFIIDPEGYIHGMETLTTSIGRCPSELIRQIKAFQNYVSTSEMAPCNWQPGNETLTKDVTKAGETWKEWTFNNNYNKSTKQD